MATVLTVGEQLRVMVAADREPTLTADEIATLLALAAVSDTLGRPPADDGWTPTYDLNRAAAEGWRWKAARVADQFDFSSEERSKFQRSQVYQACLAQAKEYSRRSVSSLLVLGAAGDGGGGDPLIFNLNGGDA